MTHSPAPWFLDPEDPLRIFSSYEPEPVICRVEPFIPDQKVALADARLIAAAPDLLDALHCLLLRWRDYLELCEKRGEAQNYVAQAKKYEKQARAAIKKATGKK